MYSTGHSIASFFVLLRASDGSSENEESSGGSGSGFGLSDSGTGLGLGGSGAGLDLGGSGFGFDLGDSGSAAGLDLAGDPNSDSGMGVAFEGGEDDDSAETRVADAVDEELNLELNNHANSLNMDLLLIKITLALYQAVLIFEFCNRNY